MMTGQQFSTRQKAKVLAMATRTTPPTKTSTDDKLALPMAARNARLGQLYRTACTVEDKLEARYNKAGGAEASLEAAIAYHRAETWDGVPATQENLKAAANIRFAAYALFMRARTVRQSIEPRYKAARHAYLVAIGAYDSEN
jgi:hypothetical protein